MDLIAEQLAASCTLYGDDDAIISGPHHALVTVWTAQGTMNVYWSGVAEIAASDEELEQWVFAEEPQKNYFDIQFSDKRSGLARQILCRKVLDVFHVSFFGQTTLAASVSFPT